MKISGISITKTQNIFKLKNWLPFIAACSMFTGYSQTHLERSPKADSVSLTKNEVPKASSSDNLREFPSPKFRINNKDKLASIVADISDRRLYYYDSNGNPVKSYPVATGSYYPPESLGVRIVEGVEEYPYSTAYGTKRKRSPSEYGPKLLRLGLIDSLNGKYMGQDGIFIHGTNKPESIGTNQSHGCMRMYNEDVIELSEKIKPGSYVLFRK